MTDPYGIKKYLEKYGSEDAKLLAMIIDSNTAQFSMSAHEGMDALKRMADVENEMYILRQLVNRGYDFTFKSDGVKLTLPDGNFYHGRSLLDAIYHLAVTVCTPGVNEDPDVPKDSWPDELKEKVLLYLASQGLTVV